jgi:cytochrome c biogenesis protein CcmG/thiol:disulfide interchange protein DsbE
MFRTTRPGTLAISPLVRIRHVIPALALMAVPLAGCGKQARSDAPAAGQVQSAFKGSPPPLTSLHDQANRLLPGGSRAFKARLAGLRGYPVVVNKWASWCGPCQSEFPVFQKVAVTFGRRVAFVGIDGKDHNQAAESFLRHFPVTYPSYADPNEDIARALQAATFYPQTLYFNRAGKQVYDHAGPYLSTSALSQDIRRYALGGG